MAYYTALEAAVINTANLAIVEDLASRAPRRPGGILAAVTSAQIKQLQDGMQHSFHPYTDEEIADATTAIVAGVVSDVHDGFWRKGYRMDMNGNLYTLGRDADDHEWFTPATIEIMKRAVECRTAARRRADARDLCAA